MLVPGCKIAACSNKVKVPIDLFSTFLNRVSTIEKASISLIINATEEFTITMSINSSPRCPWTGQGRGEMVMDVAITANLGEL